MYLSLTCKNQKKAQVNDDSWPRVEARGQRWERTDPGIWENITTGSFAILQNDDTWEYEGKRFSCIKRLMLDESNKLTTA